MRTFWGALGAALLVFAAVGARAEPAAAGPARTPLRTFAGGTLGAELPDLLSAAGPGATVGRDAMGVQVQADVTFLGRAAKAAYSLAGLSLHPSTVRLWRVELKLTLAGGAAACAADWPALKAALIGAYGAADEGGYDLMDGPTPLADMTYTFSEHAQLNVNAHFCTVDVGYSDTDALNGPAGAAP